MINKLSRDELIAILKKKNIFDSSYNRKTLSLHRSYISEEEFFKAVKSPGGFACDFDGNAIANFYYDNGKFIYNFGNENDGKSQRAANRELLYKKYLEFVRKYS